MLLRRNFFLEQNHVSFISKVFFVGKIYRAGLATCFPNPNCLQLDVLRCISWSVSESKPFCWCISVSKPILIDFGETTLSCIQVQPKYKLVIFISGAFPFKW